MYMYMYMYMFMHLCAFGYLFRHTHENGMRDIDAMLTLERVYSFFLPVVFTYAIPVNTVARGLVQNYFATKGQEGTDVLTNKELKERANEWSA